MQKLTDAELDRILARRNRPVAAAQDVETLVTLIRQLPTFVVASIGPDLQQLMEEAGPGVVIAEDVGGLPDPIDPEDADVGSIAMVCHEANRVYCRLIGDDSQPSWEDAPDWQKASAELGVMFHLQNPMAGPNASHESWLAQKEATGWVYGEVKDPEKKEHPCMVPFEALPVEQQRKDWLFRAIVHALVGWP